MIDARRMEVYSAFYDYDNKIVREICADIIDKDSCQKELANKVIFFGDGSEKIDTTIINNNAIFISDFHPSARFVGALSYIKFLAGDFEDIAYFEPYYLKDFVVGKKN
jgi:tRNA threonylcarbamoyladenosine biosynthesis protein TsaB